MLDNYIATCVATILPQLRVASKVIDSKMNEAHDSKVKVPGGPGAGPGGPGVGPGGPRLKNQGLGAGP